MYSPKTRLRSTPLAMQEGVVFAKELRSHDRLGLEF